MISALPFLLLAAAPVPAAQSAGARVTTVAQVEIIRAVEISFKPAAADIAVDKDGRVRQATDRQFARRGDMPMVEFY